MKRLADRIPNRDRSIGATETIALLSVTGSVLLAFILLLYTLERLGLPGNVIVALMLGAVGCGVALIAWLGRSVNGYSFFLAGQSGNSLPVGLGGASCWLSGAFIITLFSLPQEARHLLLVAMMLGLALQASMFASNLRTTGTSTLPGLVMWRYKASHTGLACLLVCLAVIAPVMLAELQVTGRLLAALSGWKPGTAMLVICVLALLPTLFGGWNALLLINACVGLWAIISMLAPALIVGFLPVLLNPAADNTTPVLAPLLLGQESGLIAAGQPFSALVTVLVLASGFAAMPHLVARLPLTSSPTTAIETLGWSGLVIFLSLSALLLSIGLIVGEGLASPIKALLQSNTTIAALPYVAVLLAGFNALSVTLFVAANTSIRTVRYYRNREAGVGSMFAVRLLAIALAALLLASTGVIDLTVPRLLLSALVLAAAGLFPVVFFSLWMPNMPAIFVSSAMILGTATASAIFFNNSVGIASAGGLGFVSGCAILTAGWIARRSRGETLTAPREDTAA